MPAIYPIPGMSTVPADEAFKELARIMSTSVSPPSPHPPSKGSESFLDTSAAEQARRIVELSAQVDSLVDDFEQVLDAARDGMLTLAAAQTRLQAHALPCVPEGEGVVLLRAVGERAASHAERAMSAAACALDLEGMQRRLAIYKVAETQRLLAALATR
jgi:hypothetical protein